MLNGLLVGTFSGQGQDELLKLMTDEAKTNQDYVEKLEAERCELNARMLLQEQINYELSRKQIDESENY